VNIELSKLSHTFKVKPLLVGGKAMEFYGLRQAGADIDFIITREDYAALAARYPDHLKDLWGDLGVCEFGFELWTCIMLRDYDDLSTGAIDAGEYLVISLEKLLLLKALGMKIAKYHADLELLVKKITEDAYAAWWPTLSQEQQARYLATTSKE